MAPKRLSLTHHRWRKGNLDTRTSDGSILSLVSSDFFTTPKKSTVSIGTIERSLVKALKEQTKIINITENLTDLVLSRGCALHSD